METPSSPSKKLSVLVPIHLSAIGSVSGRWTTMQVERISEEALFLISKEYVRPHSGFEVLAWEDGTQEPLHFMVTALFVERTWAGFGVAARIERISAANQKRLARLYAEVQAYSPLSAHEAARRTAFYAQQQLVVQERALPATVLQALQRQGVRIHLVQTQEQALTLVQQGKIQLIVWTINHGAQDGRELCRQLAELPEPPRSVLITGRGTTQDFETGLYAGAAMVIARPCEIGMLIIRIQDLLRSKNSAHEDKELADNWRPLKRKATARRSTSVLTQVSDQVAAWWLSTRVFFRSSAYQRLSALTFS